MSPRPAEPIPAGVAPLFAALGDPTRLALLSRLGDGRSRSISELTEGLGQSRQGVTKHLRILERAELVRSRRAGRESRFTLVPEGIAAARDHLARAARQWDAAAERLRAFVEDE